MSSVVSVFNNHFMELLEDILVVFPDNMDILAVKNTTSIIRKSNPKMLVDLWHINVTLKYKDEIKNDNIDFFIEMDYSDEISKNKNIKNANHIMNCIETLRGPIRHMGDDNKLKMMRYIQNLSKLSTVHYSKQ